VYLIASAVGIKRRRITAVILFLTLVNTVVRQQRSQQLHQNALVSSGSKIILHHSEIFYNNESNFSGYLLSIDFSRYVKAPAMS
jgi:hypothetical protein